MFIYIYTYIYTYVGGSLLGRGLELLLVPLLEQRPRLRRRLLILPKSGLEPQNLPESGYETGPLKAVHLSRHKWPGGDQSTRIPDASSRTDERESGEG